MKTRLAEKPIALSLPLFLLLILVIFLCGSTQTLEAKPQDVSGEAFREVRRFGLLDYQLDVSICEQTYNRVRNPGFEEGIGPANGWVETGKCVVLEDPGYNSATSARILALSSIKKECKLFTPLEEIAIEADRYYDYAVRVKADLQSGDANLVITFWQLQNNTWRLVGDPAPTRLVSDTQGVWVQLTGSVRAPSDAGYARVEATLNESSEGSVWFDDVFFGLATCLDISKTHNPNQVMPGQLLTYTITYTNTGREEATGVQVIETFDKDVDFWSAQPPPNLGNNIWLTDSLGPDESGTIAATVRVENEARERNYLFNTVQILSNETLEPISITLPTRVITPDTCAIYVDPPAVTGYGRRGQAVHYGLIVRNAGEHAGEVVLTAASSQGWAFEFDPAAHTLPVSASKPVSFSLQVPSDLSDGHQDVSLVKATITCANEQSAMATSTVRTTAMVPVFLPSVVRNSRDPFWEVEPNDSCDEANGPILPGVEYYGYPDDERDVFGVEIHTRGELSVGFTIHEPEGVQLQLRDQNCNLITYDWDPPFGIEYTMGPGDYYICIYTDPEYQDANKAYTLRAEFPD